MSPAGGHGAGTRPRVWVMRDEPRGGPLCSAIEAAGLEAVWEPVLERRITGDLTEVLAGAGEEDWLILTSTYAIAHVPRAACRVAVVGEASRREAEARGLRVELVSADGKGEAMWTELASRTRGARRIIYPRSSLANPPRTVGGIPVEAPVFYETSPRRFDAGRVRDVACAVVTSPSAARSLAEVRDRPRCASIGPTTSSALRAMGIEPWVESGSARFEDLAARIAAALRP